MPDELLRGKEQRGGQAVLLRKFEQSSIRAGLPFFVRIGRPKGHNPSETAKQTFEATSDALSLSVVITRSCAFRLSRTSWPRGTSGQTHSCIATVTIATRHLRNTLS